MVKNYKIMKTVEITNANENKVDSAEANKTSSHQKADDSFERLFYDTINVFAYSKFYEVSLNPQECCSVKYLDLVKNLYENFVEKKGFFFGKKEIETYKKINVIIDEFCAEKFKKFMNTMSCNQEKHLIDRSIAEFINENDRNIDAVSKECLKKPENNSIEYVMRDLQEQDPQKFKELIDFEINKKELKDANDKIRFMVGDIKIKPATIFLNEIKKHSNLEKASSKNRNQRSFCAIS